MLGWLVAALAARLLAWWPYCGQGASPMRRCAHNQGAAPSRAASSG